MHRRFARQRPHQLVHVFKLFERLPAGITLTPIKVRRQPDGERLGEIFIRMALRIPVVEMHHVTAAERPRTIKFRCLISRRLSESLLPFFLFRQLIGVAVSVRRFVPDQSHEPLWRSALDFEHHRLLQLAQPVVHEKKRHEDRRDADRHEPFIADMSKADERPAPSPTARRRAAG